jgi:hypothetical protein
MQRQGRAPRMTADNNEYQCRDARGRPRRGHPRGASLQIVPPSESRRAPSSKRPARFPARAQFASFNFPNNLIRWEMSTPTLSRRSRHRRTGLHDRYGITNPAGIEIRTIMRFLRRLTPRARRSGRLRDALQKPCCTKPRSASQRYGDLEIAVATRDGVMSLRNDGSDGMAAISCKCIGAASLSCTKPLSR